jgi:hypothetical protein
LRKTLGLTRCGDRLPGIVRADVAGRRRSHGISITRGLVARQARGQQSGVPSRARLGVQRRAGPAVRSGTRCASPQAW